MLFPRKERHVLSHQTNQASGAPEKKAYEKPEVRTEAMFETSALACGKCMSGPVGQYQCGSLLQNS